MKQILESSYPITFRKNDAQTLGSFLLHNQSVMLIGMKRVGISNFLRFFLHSPAVTETYISKSTQYVFVQVDFNDLIERNLSAFWTLLLTRLVDAVQSSSLPETEKRASRRMFVQSIQLKDNFFTVDSVRKVLGSMVSGGLHPVLFFLRFDRLSGSLTSEFFSNLVGLKDGVNKKMTYVLTSARTLTDIDPAVFPKQLVSTFGKDMYLTPAAPEDLRIIAQTLMEQHHAVLDPQVLDALIELSGGYVQYLQLAIVRLREEKHIPTDRKALHALLVKDEQIALQSEELFESLTKTEKEIILSLKQGNPPTQKQREAGAYIWNTGMVLDTKDGASRFFSPLFEEFVSKVSAVPVIGKDFTKKEHLLYSYLEAHVGELCERESLIEAVWPENRDFGVSDWAIDRLVARLRGKLKEHASPYQIVTVVTRGYKLIPL